MIDKITAEEVETALILVDDDFPPQEVIEFWSQSDRYAAFRWATEQMEYAMAPEGGSSPRPPVLDKWFGVVRVRRYKVYLELGYNPQDHRYEGNIYGKNCLGRHTEILQAYHCVADFDKPERVELDEQIAQNFVVSIDSALQKQPDDDLGELFFFLNTDWE